MLTIFELSPFPDLYKCGCPAVDAGFQSSQESFLVLKTSSSFIGKIDFQACTQITISRESPTSSVISWYVLRANRYFYILITHFLKKKNNNKNTLFNIISIIYLIHSNIISLIFIYSFFFFCLLLFFLYLLTIAICFKVPTDIRGTDRRGMYRSNNQTENTCDTRLALVCKIPT